MAMETTEKWMNSMRARLSSAPTALQNKSFFSQNLGINVSTDEKKYKHYNRENKKNNVSCEPWLHISHKFSSWRPSPTSHITPSPPPHAWPTSGGVFPNVEMRQIVSWKPFVSSSTRFCRVVCLNVSGRGEEKRPRCGKTNSISCCGHWREMRHFVCLSISLNGKREAMVIVLETYYVDAVCILIEAAACCGIFPLLSPLPLKRWEKQSLTCPWTMYQNWIPCRRGPAAALPVTQAHPRRRARQSAAARCPAALRYTSSCHSHLIELSHALLAGRRVSLWACVRHNTLVRVGVS